MNKKVKAKKLGIVGMLMVGVMCSFSASSHLSAGVVAKTKVQMSLNRMFNSSGEVIQIIWADGSGTTTTNPGNLVNDLTPQLGGNLDVNGFSLVSLANGDINFSPHGTGNIGINVPGGDPADRLEIYGAIKVSDANIGGDDEGIRLNINSAGGGINLSDGNSTVTAAFEGRTGTDSYINNGGNFGLGTSTFDGSAAGTLAIGNGNAPVAGTVNQSSIYAKDVTASSEMHVMDEAGNETVISPHAFVLFTPDVAHAMPWSYYSKNPYIGKEVNIDMYAMAKAIETLSGEKFIYEQDLPLAEQREWTDDQASDVSQQNDKLIAKKMEEEVEVTKVIDGFETVEIMEVVEIDKTVYSYDDNGKITSKVVKVKVEQGIGTFKKDVKTNHRFDKTTGKIYRKKTLAEATAEITPVKAKQPPQWMIDRGVTLN